MRDRRPRTLRLNWCGCHTLLIGVMVTAAVLGVCCRADLGVPSPALTYDRLPLYFEPNRGQGEAGAQYLARGSGYALSLHSNEAVLALRHDRHEVAQLRIALLGANPNPPITPLGETTGRVNYLIGNDPRRWRTEIPTYLKVRLAGVYPGVDLVYYGTQGKLEYDFIVAPGADPQTIRLSFAGGGDLSISKEGELVLRLGERDVRWSPPHAFQEAGGETQVVQAAYVLSQRGEVGFTVGDYDKAKPLTIDPLLLYATYLGGSLDDAIRGIAVDASGHVYVTGETASSDFPKKNPFQQNFGTPSEAFVTKLGPTGTNLIFSTYLGGNNSDFGSAIAVDASTNVYVLGFTDSSNFPTQNGYQSGPSGFADVFVVKLNSAGSAMLYGSFLGGADDDVGNGIAVDSTGRIHITGTTTSLNFPTKNGYRATFQGGLTDAFMARFNPTASGSASLLYSTYLGGNDDEEGQGIAVDSSARAYVTGSTSSTNFPVTAGVVQTNLQSFFVDAFVTKLNPANIGSTSIVYSTYLGGADAENLIESGSITVDSSGNAHLTGSTSSTNFPVTAGAFRTNYGGGFSDAFVTKLNSNATAVLYSTFFGGEADDFGSGIVVDSSNRVYTTGTTASTNFPATPGSFQPGNGGGDGDAYVAKLNPAAPANAFVVHSTFLGGAGDDQPHGIAVDSAGNAYVGGETSTNQFPVTTGAFQTNWAGATEGFVAKIIPSADMAVASSASANSVLVGGNLTYIAIVTNRGESAATGVALTNTLSPNVTYVSSSTTTGTCTHTGGVVTCNIGNMATGDKATVTINVTAVAPGLATNTAKVVASQPDPLPANNTTSIVTAVGSVVSVTADDPNASEPGGDTGRFLVQRTGSTQTSLTINYAISGSASPGLDYVTLGGTVTINSGSFGAFINITPLDDVSQECPETVVVTILSGMGYAIGSSSSATVTIADNEQPTVTLAATDPDASEAGPGTGLFTVSHNGCTNSALVVNYTISGTAAPSADYPTNSLSGVVTIPAGTNSVVLTITPVNDATGECPETVVLTLSASANYNLGAPSSDTVTIADNDSVVTIMASDSTASEPGSDTSTFTVSRTGCTTVPLTVNYAVSGTAAAGVDYVALTNSVTIPQGLSSTTITVTPVDDLTPECSETVVVTVSAGTAYTVGSPSAATVTIADDEMPVVTIAATDPTASETTPNNGTFTVSRVGCTTASLTVNYSVGGSAVPGSDYTVLSGSVTIPMNLASATITVSPVNDELVEEDETMAVTLISGPYAIGSPGSGTVVILDNDRARVSVAAAGPSISEVATNSGAFIFSRDGFTNSDLMVSFTVSGNASNGVDYVQLPDTVTIPTGTNSIALPLTAIEDLELECVESVTVSITTNALYAIGPSTNATVGILDNELPTITVANTDPSASEPGTNTGLLTILRDCTNGVLQVNCLIAGTASNGLDYVALTNSVAISNGFSSAALTVTPLDDAVLECPEAVTLTVLTNSAYIVGTSSNGTVTIVDNDFNVTVTAADADASEPGVNPGAFRIAHAGCTNQPLTVNYVLSGAATAGVDYSTNSLLGSVIVPAGTNAVSLTVPPSDDALIECPETVVLTISTNSAYTIGAATNATVSIADDDVPVVGIVVVDSAASEPGADTALFAVSITGGFCTNTALVVHYTLSGAATAGADYLTNSLTGVVTIPAGTNSVSVEAAPLDDLLLECPETVTINLVADPNYALGSQSNATATIYDNEVPTVTVSATDGVGAESGPDTGALSFSRTGCTVSNLTVNYTLGGTATAGADYLTNALTGSVTIPAGLASTSLTVTPVNDAASECDESVVLTVAASANYAIGGSGSGSVTILDNDTLVTITASDPNASEVGLEAGQFVITRAGCSNAALTVSYSVTGNATAGADYSALPATAIIPAGSNTVTLAVSPLQDATAECDESVTVTLSGSFAYTVGAPAAATVTIVDNDATVNVTASDASASEPGANTGTFTVSRNCTAGPLIVNYTLGGSAAPGTDYLTNALTGSVTIPSGSNAVNLIVTPVDDLLVECLETIMLTVSTSAAYTIGATTNATVNITETDVPLVGITATDPAAAEPGANTGTFVISIAGSFCTNTALAVQYALGGTATPGADYSTNALTGSAIIPAGTNSVSLTLTPLDDAPVECPETAVVSLLPSASYGMSAQSNATVTVSDDELPTVSLSVTDAAASEFGTDPATILVSRVGCTTSNLTVQYTLGGSATLGTDYLTNALTGSVTVPAGSTSTNLTVTPINDGSAECDETVTVALSADASYLIGAQSNATVTITDNDTSVSVAASDSGASEIGLDPGQFTISRVGCTTQPLTVQYAVTGSATGGSDYSALSTSVVMPAGSNSVAITVTPVNDALAECPETVVLTLSANPSYAVGTPGSGTVTIADNDSQVTITATDSAASEPGTNTGAFTISRTGCTTVPLTVNYALSGTASNGVDYGALPGFVTIAVNSNATVIVVTSIDDLLVEGAETAVATITSNVAYVVGAPGNATINIADNDTPPSLTITSTTFSVTIGNGNSTADPGETVQETVVLRNSGTTAATNVAATLSTATAGVTFLQASSPYPNVPGGDTSTNSVAFAYRLAKTIPCGTTITFTHVATTAGQTFTNSYTRFIGQSPGTITTNLFESTNVPKSVANLTTILSTNTVALAGSNTVVDVNVTVRMNETRDGDVEIAVQHPGGTEVMLSDNRGGSGANFGTGTCGAGEVRTVFDDEAATLISAGAAPFAGSFRPDGVLTNLDGRAVNGHWQLRVSDNQNPTSSGTLSCWALRIISQQQQSLCTVFNNPPVASNQTVSVAANTSTNLILKGSDPDGDPITFSTNSPPAHGTQSNFNSLTGTITYTPSLGFIGADSFTFAVNDGSANSAPAIVSITVGGGDTDGDGMPDDWETANGLNPNNPGDANQDADGDGMTNLQEFLTGTDPQNSASALRITGMVVSGNDCLVSFTTVVGKLYRLDRASLPSGDTWTTVANNVVGTGGTVQAADTGGASATNRFYRVGLGQ